MPSFFSNANAGSGADGGLGDDDMILDELGGGLEDDAELEVDNEEDPDAAVELPDSLDFEVRPPPIPRPSPQYLPLLSSPLLSSPLLLPPLHLSPFSNP